MGTLWPTVADSQSREFEDILFCIRTPRPMFGRACQAAFLVALFLTSLGLGVVESSILHDEHRIEQRSQGVSGVVDVPTYRIGDEWVYETKFDVSQLLAQANVSASLNALTGDTTNRVTDGFSTPPTTTGTRCWPTKSRSAVVSPPATAPILRASPADSTSTTTASTSFVRGIWPPSPAISPSKLRSTLQPRVFGTDPRCRQTFENTYTSAKERYDFPIRNGDQWWMEFEAETTSSGSSDYFDPTSFDSQEDENNSWQVIKNEAPVEDGDSPQYTGCDDAYKIAEWNATGVNLGFNLHCPAVRGSVWNRIVNPAGFTIDWILKTYNPADSNSMNPSSSPGGRNTDTPSAPPQPPRFPTPSSRYPSPIAWQDRQHPHQEHQPATSIRNCGHHSQPNHGQQRTGPSRPQRVR